MNVIEAHENPEVAKTCRGTIAMVTRDNVAAQTAMSWLMTDMSFLGPGEYTLRYIVQGNVLVFQRNECIQKMDGDWVLFLDSDMTWQPDAIKRIVETRDRFDLDILGGLCFQRGEPHQPTLYVNGSHGGYTFMEKWPEDAAIEVDATGMAFCIIHKRVFDKILRHHTGEGFPELDERMRMSPPPFFTWDGEFGEDFRFCRDAKAAGCRIFVDTSIKIGHVGQQVITEKTFMRELAFRSDEQQAFREAQLEAIGLEALKREEALEKATTLEKGA